MLRIYTQISHPISTLHSMLTHLVCEVWCKSKEGIICSDLLSPDFKELYEHLDWLKKDTDIVFEKCKTLSDPERQNIIDAFITNNDIENLCAGTVQIIELNTLPKVIREEVKNLLESFYSRLLDIKKVPGDKLGYYNELIKFNKFNTCPICGLADIEDEESNYIEDYDHFFPKSHYPFAAVNFKNLVPTCDKCNKKYKGSKKPLDYNGKTYFPFEAGRSEIKVTCELEKIEFDKENKLSKKPNFNFTGDNDKNATWNWLYGIEGRYEIVLKRNSYSWLRTLKKEIEINPAMSVNDYIDFKINNYFLDRYDEKKFLKIALLEALKTKPEWITSLNHQ